MHRLFCLVLSVSLAVFQEGVCVNDKATQYSMTTRLCVQMGKSIILSRGPNWCKLK